ncbi:MAG TPA: hypothetical protein VKW77_01430 [Acidimicrobiales bacterium]|nr:hypothetical protein [Acidimicrobiales bacterium]
MSLGEAPSDEAESDEAGPDQAGPGHPGPDEAEQTFPASDPVAHWAGVDPRDRPTRRVSVTDEEPRVDPQDRQFGAAAARDQEAEERLEDEGVAEGEMPEEARAQPRAGGKAEPADGEPG